jgi:hypothetical protein
VFPRKIIDPEGVSQNKLVTYDCINDPTPEIEVTAPDDTTYFLNVY